MYYRNFPTLGIGKILDDKNYTDSNVPMRLRFIKTGDTPSGHVIPAGLIATYTAGTLHIAKFMLSKSTTITAPSCKTRDINVKMGQYKLDDFPTDGSPSKRTVPFSINIYNCPAGINKVMYSLVPISSSPAWNTTQGIIKLNQNSTAKGIGLQILDDNLTPLILDQAKLFSEYSAGGDNFTIPFNARYLKIPDGPSISPGTANTEMTFVMSYL
ncbi:fimbrial protein [Pseudomonas sp. MF7453]|uniref:fimbrial protein n=1 Tax=Pseudomonas sp. MF7453 TaxID=2797539 RepID=UPI0018E7F817|nr:fimbrial protein [Pseudomonas sp. MF7453]MBJ2220630.1 type 1 fimbrial protein [Pseudomonas sp. MF7453]